MTRDELVEFLSEALGICGCSDTDDAVGFLKDLLEAGEMRGLGHEAEANAVLDNMMPGGDCLERNLPIYWINSAGLTEHGYTLSEYVLSDVGNAVLAAIREHGEQDALWSAGSPPPDRMVN